MHRCLHDKAPKYLVDCCTPVSDIASRRHLRSASRHHLTVPRHRLSTFGHRAFSIAGLTVRNSLLDSLHDPALSSDRFRQLLNVEDELIFALPLSTHSAVEMLHDSALCKFMTDIDVNNKNTAIHTTICLQTTVLY